MGARVASAMAAKRMTGQTVRKFGDDVRGGRRDQKQVRAIREINVTGPPVFFFIVEAASSPDFWKAFAK